MNCHICFWESSGFKRRIKPVKRSTQIRIGIVREGTDALPSALGELASQHLLTKHKISFMEKIITKGEPIAPKADLSALYKAVVADPTNYHHVSR
jgi:hypothetical protein